MCQKRINTIDFLAGLFLELENELRKENHIKKAMPLLDQLREEAETLTVIFNELCWFESFYNGF